MATINSFPNNSDEYIGAEEVMRWLHGRTSGVYGDTGNAAVSAVQNAMAVSVAKGIGWLTDADGNGIVWWSGSATQLAIDAAEPTGTLNRIDRVIVRWYIGDYSDKPELLVLKGTNASVPTPPAINTDARYKEISLAQVSIPAGTTAISPLFITDERFNPDVCGIVTETVTADTSMISAQYADAIDVLDETLDTLNEDFDVWFANLQYVLDGDVAGHLQNEIDNIVYVGGTAPEDYSIKLWLDTDSSGVSAVNSVNNKNGNVVLDAADVGAMAKWVLLWENASPTSDFAAQTLQIDVSAYEFIAVEHKVYPALEDYRTDFGRVGTKIGLVHPASGSGYFGTASAQFGTRGVDTTTTTQIAIGSGYASASGGQFAASNNRCIPYRIYGIKGVITT